MARCLAWIGLGLLALSLTGCFLNRAGLAPFDAEFDVRPQILCEGEATNVSWDIDADRLDRTTVLITQSPGGVVDVEPPGRNTGSVSFVPRPPATEADIRSTAINKLAILRKHDGDDFTQSVTTPVFVVGSEATYPHQETFKWGCFNAPGGGSAGWTRVDYERGQKASSSMRVTSVQNLSTVPVIVGVRRDPADSVSMLPLGIGATTTALNGEFWGVWQAVPEFTDFGGADGCEDELPPGSVVLGPRSPTVITPRPDLILGIQLACNAL
ncbi:hypothetical protein GCM10008090_32140 [Arenicella chitinivorans]|uniref:Uncharacterized protein n=1 Tax=Arenicella chitinivorans TaxID=1329800 RepID=A0A918VSY8_9GAMM|nr:hypothetical protein [Arenicella chitinivorans]GHA19927.1 hypothetical protein GCM10008090_32140 [Arenicella chitinivorans]